jgi:phospholipid/cholesterol/gamma-HCH transport system substrate-binding protein
MVNRNAFETAMGGVVLLGAAVFMLFVYTSTRSPAMSGGYNVVARFTRVDGLRDGSDVRVGGIKVGTVTSQRLDPRTRIPEVGMTIDTALQIPTDTMATIASTGLLGENYVDLELGNDEEQIKADGVIARTEAAINIFSIISKYLSCASRNPT